MLLLGHQNTLSKREILLEINFHLTVIFVFACINTKVSKSLIRKPLVYYSHSGERVGNIYMNNKKSDARLIVINLIVALWIWIESKQEIFHPQNSACFPQSLACYAACQLLSSAVKCSAVQCSAALPGCLFLSGATPSFHLLVFSPLAVAPHLMSARAKYTCSDSAPLGLLWNGSLWLRWPGRLNVAFQVEELGLVRGWRNKLQVFSKEALLSPPLSVGYLQRV